MIASPCRSRSLRNHPSLVDRPADEVTIDSNVIVQIPPPSGGRSGEGSERLHSNNMPGIFLDHAGIANPFHF
jgi:hypothetical protein